MATVTITLSYNAGGGSPTPSSQKATIDSNDLDPVSFKVSSTRPTRTGYNFSSWGGYAPGSTIALTSSKTLTAKWSEKTYTVSFNANGGSSKPEDVKKKYFSDLILTDEIPTYTGKTFKSWNTAADGSGTEYAPGGSYTTNAALTLYAQWEPTKYKVTYNANGGTGAPASQTKTHGEDLQLTAAVPSLANMGFKGWATEQDGTEVKYIPGAMYTENADLTLYAVWGAGKTVSYNANGGTGAPQPQLKFETGVLNLSDVEPTREGYTFDHWNTDPNDGGTNYRPNEPYNEFAELTLYAIWKANSYTITFGEKTKQVVYGSEIGSIDPATRTGYTFAGWYYGSEPWTASTIYNVAGDVELTAAWTANSYTISFEAAGGESPEAEIKVVYDMAIGDLPEPTRNGYIFAGWTYDESFLTPETIYKTAEDIEAVAAWTPRHYTVTYDPGEGSGTPFTQDITQDEPWVSNGSNAFHKVGHHQVSWGDIGMGQEVSSWCNMTLTASYRLHTFVITIAGIGTMDVQYGSVIGHIPPLERPGKQFVGWSVEGQLIRYDDRYLWDRNVTASPVYKDLKFTPADLFVIDDTGAHEADPIVDEITGKVYVVEEG